MNNCNSISTHRAAPNSVEGAAVPHTVPAGRSGRARTGKIARLPHAVREALNERLHNGLPAVEILAWLNELAEVREALAKYFNGAAISEANLAQWRHGGYVGWLEHQRATHALSIMSAAGRNMDQEERDALTGNLALVVTARMVAELQTFDAMPEGPAKTAAWKDLVWSLTLLRRGEFYAGKLRLEQEKLAPQREEARKAPECEQEELEQTRQIMGMDGPHWNNFTKEWEGEGAAEMTEKQEVERLVVAEYLRRKAAKGMDQLGTPPNLAGPATGFLPEEQNQG